MGSNRILATLMGVLATLVLVVGGLSAVLLLSGGDDDGGGDGGTSTSSGISTGGTSSESSTDNNNRLRLAGGDPITMDPHRATDSGSGQYIVEIYSGLVTIDPDLNVVLDLAESVDVSEDGLVYTFTLRNDAVFHNGRRVTAEDVRWSIERAASRALTSPVALAYLGDIVGVRDKFFGIADDISGLTVIDERTIQFTLDAPKPYFLAKLTYPTAFVVDREQVEANPNNWTRRPNGTGPYRLVEWRLGERIVLRANERFYLGAPKLHEVLYELSGGSPLTRFENGDLDVARLGVNDVDRARDPLSELNPLYVVFPDFTITYIAFNVNVPPFDDVHFRRALALSIDRKTIAEVTFSGMWQQATGILPPQLPGFEPSDKTYPYDPEAARAALALSKYHVEDGRLIDPEGRTVLIEISQQGGGAEASIDMQAFVELWRQELAVEVEIRQSDSATFFADSREGRLQAFNAGWVMDYPDPESVLDLKLHSESSLNDGNYSNPDFDRLIELARTEADPIARVRLYQQAERLVIEDVAWIPLYFPVSHVVIAPGIKGFVDPPMTIPRLRFVEITR